MGNAASDSLLAGLVDDAGPTRTRTGKAPRTAVKGIEPSAVLFSASRFASGRARGNGRGPPGRGREDVAVELGYLTVTTWYMPALKWPGRLQTKT